LVISRRGASWVKVKCGISFVEIKRYAIALFLLVFLHGWKGNSMGLILEARGPSKQTFWICWVVPSLRHAQSEESHAFCSVKRARSGT